MQIDKSELIMFSPSSAYYVLSLKAKFKKLCDKCMSSSQFSWFLQVLISHASKIRLFRQFVLVCKILKIWCGQNVNSVPLKLTCVSVYLQPLFDVLWARWKIFVSFPRYSFCHKLGRELNKLCHKSDLLRLGLLVWEINCRWYGVVLKKL